MWDLHLLGTGGSVLVFCKVLLLISGGDVVNFFLMGLVCGLGLGFFCLYWVSWFTANYAKLLFWSKRHRTHLVKWSWFVLVRSLHYCIQ